MINSIIKFYDRELSTYQLVFQHMKFTYYTFLASGLLSIVTLFPAIFMESSISKVIFAILIAIFSIYYVLLHIQAKKIVRRKFHIEQRDFTWGGVEFYNKKVDIFKVFLEKNEINTLKKLEELLKLLNKEAENRKYTGLIIPGTFLAFTVPIWNHFVGWFFNKISDINLLIAYGMVLAFFILLFAIGYGMLKTVFKELVDRQSRKIKEIEGMLEHIYFKYILEDRTSQ